MNGPDEVWRLTGRVGPKPSTTDDTRDRLAAELLDAVKGLLEFERLNSVISGPYDRLRLAYNAVIQESNASRLSLADAPDEGLRAAATRLLDVWPMAKAREEARVALAAALAIDALREDADKT